MRRRGPAYPPFSRRSGRQRARLPAAGSSPASVSPVVCEADGSGAVVRLIARRHQRSSRPGSTHTPIAVAHVTVSPGAELTVPWRPDFNSLVYVWPTKLTRSSPRDSTTAARSGCGRQPGSGSGAMDHAVVALAPQRKDQPLSPSQRMERDHARPLLPPSPRPDRGATRTRARGAIRSLAGGIAAKRGHRRRACPAERSGRSSARPHPQ